MTTLLLSEIFPPKTGGSGRWLWEVYRRLPRDEYRIVAGSDPGQASFDATHDLDVKRLDLSFPTRLVRRSSLPHYRSALREIGSLARSERVRAIHCGRCLPEGLLALAHRARSGTPYMCFTHGEEVNLSNSTRRPPWHRRAVYGSRELGLIVGQVLRRASFLVANSQNTRTILTERWGIPAEKVHLLYPGVDARRFRPAPRSTEIRARLGWQGRRVLLTVGRLQQRKGHDVMISALPRILETVPEALYAIVGTGEELEALRRLVERKGLGGRVQFLLEVDDEELIRCYQQCDLFVLPNRQIGSDIEGFGMVLLEAQACGKPVVAGASGGTSETMRVAETGHLVACDEPNALADLVAELLADPDRLRTMGEAAREWVAERFDWQPLSRQAHDLFERQSRRRAG